MLFYKMKTSNTSRLHARGESIGEGWEMREEEERRKKGADIHYFEWILVENQLGR